MTPLGFTLGADLETGWLGSPQAGAGPGGDEALTTYGPHPLLHTGLPFKKIRSRVGENSVNCVVGKRKRRGLEAHAG